MSFTPVFTVRAEAQLHVIEIDKMKFGAAPAGIHAGDTIIWKNADLVKHSATARDGSFDIDLPRKSQDSMIVKNTGTVDVYCRYHPGMIMTLVITP
ncbi:amicyanin [Parvibaculum sp.]|uniref:amicyanin n=2 Tax=Parvibaculum sp. TaxID=2024848 RepID=UPI003299EE84